MKKKVSISMEEAVLEQVQDKLKEGLFRNQSHLIEYAAKRFLCDKEVKNG